MQNKTLKKRYKVAIGIPTLNEEQTINYVTKQIDIGINKYFDANECIIINLNNNSTDNTRQIFLNTPTKTSKKSITIVPRGKGKSILCFFKYCVENNIPYVATFDGDLRSIEPTWVYKLLSPIINGFDYVLPIYTRNRFEANITNHFAFPLIYAISGLKIRQPLGGEFGYSLRLCKYILETPKYPKNYGFGIDIFTTCCAIGGDFNVTEVYLGKKIHSPSYYHMETTFRHVFESGLYLLKLFNYKNVKKRKIKLLKTPIGIDPSLTFPQKNKIPYLVKQLRNRFLKYRNKQYYEFFIKDDLLMKRISEIVKKENIYSMSKELWVGYLRLIIKNVFSKNFRIDDLKVLSKISIPIYRWRAISYWLEVEKSKSSVAEKIIYNQAVFLKNSLGYNVSKLKKV